MYALLRILSLDVVLGAIASGSMVVYLRGEEMPWIWWLALPLSVWVIYTADHLLDAYRLKEHASTDRHRFHYRYMKPIGGIWVIGLMSCMSWIPWLAPPELLWFGLGMGGLVLIHLALVYWVGNRISVLFVKEVGVGTIYAAGVWGGPLALHPPDAWLPWILLFLQFWALAMINLLTFSMYEREIDEKDGHTSFVRAIGTKRTRQLILGIGGGVLGLGASLLYLQPGISWQLAQGVTWGMLAILIWVVLHERFFAPNERYRIWGDAVFLLPGIIWVMV